MSLNDTLQHIGNVNIDLALMGVAPSSLAAVEQVAQANGRRAHLKVSRRGIRGCLLIDGQHVVHAEVRSSEVHVATDRPGHLLWHGEAALRALALLCNHPVEVEIVTTDDPVSGHASNILLPISLALFEMAMALDHGMDISALPCVFEPVADAA